MCRKGVRKRELRVTRSQIDVHKTRRKTVYGRTGGGGLANIEDATHAFGLEVLADNSVQLDLVLVLARDLLRLFQECRSGQGLWRGIDKLSGHSDAV